MKWIIIALFFTTSSVISQENFSVKNNYITWEKEFPSLLSEEEIYTHLQNHPALRNLAGKLSGRSGLITKNCDTKGTAIFLRNNFHGYVTISISLNSYAVKIDDISFQTNLIVDLGAVETSDQDTKIEQYLLRKSDKTLRSNKQAKKDLECIDQTLTSLFQFQ